MREPWERLTGESAKTYANFVLYRDMGPERSLRKVAEGGEGTAKIRQLEKWSVKCRWVDRAQAYDDEMDRQLRARNEKTRKEMNERHAKVGQFSQNVALRRLEKLVRDIEGEKSTMSAADTARLLDVGVKIERLSREPMM